MVLGVLPTFVFFRGVRDFINWRAFAFSLGALLPVSIVWEATLGVPYDWWNYKPEQMIGIRVMAWAHLPFEAVMLWLVVAWVAVIVYEIFKLYGNMGCTAREALFGVREQGSPQPRTEARP